MLTKNNNHIPQSIAANTKTVSAAAVETTEPITDPVVRKMVYNNNQISSL